MSATYKVPQNGLEQNCTMQFCSKSGKSALKIRSALCRTDFDKMNPCADRRRLTLQIKTALCRFDFWSAKYPYVGRLKKQNRTVRVCFVAYKADDGKPVIPVNQDCKLQS